MKCHDLDRFVDLRLDHEFEPADSEQFEAHLSICRSCCERFESRRRLRDALKSKLRAADGAIAASDALTARVRADLRASLREEQTLARRVGRPWGILAAAGAATAMILSFSFSSERDSSPLIPEEAVVRHGRNLPPEVRADRDDGRRVERFLERNLEYAVRVPRFSGSNPHVKLVGARLSNLADREAAYMMYDHRGAKVSLFAFPKPARFVRPEGFEDRRAGDRRVLVGRRRGYNVVAWEERDVMYSLVSDVDPSELIELVSSAEP